MRQKMFMDENETGEQTLEVTLRVGEVLSSARNKNKKEIEKIAEKLRIRSRYLEALENSEYDVFPGRIYALGFLKAYAEFLGLDADDLVTRYKEEIKGVSEKPVIMPMPESQVILPSLKILAGALVLGVVIWLLWYFFSFREEKEPVLPPITQEEPLVEAQVVVEEKKEEPKQQETPAVNTKKEEAKPADKKANATKKNRVQLKAKEEVWIEILNDDTLVISKVLKKGEIYDVPSNSAEMTLKTANAGGLEVIVDSQTLKKPLGPVGAIRSNISLDPEKLKNR